MDQVVNDYKEEARFVMDLLPNAHIWYDLEGWKRFLAWMRSIGRVIILDHDSEIVAVAFFWQLEDPDFDFTNGRFPEESEEGEYLYCPVAVIHENHRGKGLVNKIIGMMMNKIENDNIKYLAYKREARGDRLTKIKMNIAKEN